MNPSYIEFISKDDALKWLVRYGQKHKIISISELKEPMQEAVVTIWFWEER